MYIKCIQLNVSLCNTIRHIKLQVMEGMKKDLRKKMESEIKDLQQQLNRDDDDAYFRQLDADRVIQDLQMAKYHVSGV